MERIYHIYIFQISRCRFICDIYRMLKRQVPNRESFKLSVSCLNPLSAVVIKLRQTCCKFTAAPSRPCNNYQWLCYLNSGVCTVSLFAYYHFHLCRIAFCILMRISFDASAVQFLDKHIHRFLLCVSCYHNAIDLKLISSKCIDKAQNFQIVCDAEILSCLVGRNIP